jgi:hypothetical protein
MYGVRQIGHVVLRRTNQETRHSEWNSWPQTCSLRMASGPDGSGWEDEDEALGADGCIAASSAVGWDAKRTGSGGEGACNVERHIALVDV